MSLKIAYNNQIHKLSKYPADFAGLSKLVGMFFKDQLPTRWVVQYTDSDGDNITVADEHDYENLIEHVKESFGKTVKVIVVEMDLNNLTTQRIEAPHREESCEMILRELESRPREEKVIEPVEEKFEEKMEDLREEVEEEKPAKYIHHNVRCDGCGRYPVEGIRYKCSECEDFDFCEDCEATTEHPHHFIKMRHSSKPARRSCPFSYLKDLVPGANYHQMSSTERSEFVHKATEALTSLKNIEGNVSQNQVEVREEEPQPEPELREEEEEVERSESVEEREEEEQEASVEYKEEVQAEVQVEEAQPEPEVQPEVQEEAPKENKPSHKPKRSNSFSNFLNSVLKVFEPSKKESKSVQEIKEEVEVKEEVHNEEVPVVNEEVAVENEEVEAVQEEVAAEEPEKVDIKSQFPREVVMLAEELKQIFVEADELKLLTLCNEFPYATIEQLADGYLRSL